MRSTRERCRAGACRGCFWPARCSTWTARSADTTSRPPGAPAGWRGPLPPEQPEHPVMRGEVSDLRRNFCPCSWSNGCGIITGRAVRPITSLHQPCEEWTPMLRVHLAGAALLSLVLALPAQAQKKDPKNPPNLPLEAEKYLKPGQLTGKLGAVNGSTFVLRLDFDRLELKPGARNQRNSNRQYTNLIREYDRLARAQQQLVRARTPQQQLTALRQIQQVTAQIQRTTLQQLGVGNLQSSPFVVKKDFRDFDVEMSTNVEIRTAFLPFAYDDMGDPK